MVGRQRRSIIVGAAIGLALGIAIAALTRSRGDDTAVLRPGVTSSPNIATAPKLDGKTLPTDTFLTWDDETVTFAGLAGKPVLVNVWSWSCVPCIAEMPDLETVYKKLGDRISFIGMNSVSDGERKAREFAEKTGVTYPLWRDLDGQFAFSLQIVNLPTTVVADSTGKIVWSSSKALTAEELTNKLTELFP